MADREKREEREEEIERVKERVVEDLALLYKYVSDIGRDTMILSLSILAKERRLELDSEEDENKKKN